MTLQRFTSVAAFLMMLAACGEVDARQGQVGTVAPPYAAVALDGDSVRLGELRGTVVLLNVWATWCAPCREEIPDLQALHEENVERGFAVVGVSVDGRREGDAIRRFVADFGMTYPIWHDPDDKVGSTFRTIGVPATFLIDREGVIRWRHLGPVQRGDAVLREAVAMALNGASGRAE